MTNFPLVLVELEIDAVVTDRRSRVAFIEVLFLHVAGVGLEKPN